MATCKECLHWCVCEWADNKESVGSEFKNKADFVGVPCRCSECKHYKRYGRTSLVFEGKNVQAGWCMLRASADEEHRMLPFDFCSYGEKNEKV